MWAYRTPGKTTNTRFRPYTLKAANRSVQGPIRKNRNTTGIQGLIRESIGKGIAG